MEQQPLLSIIIPIYKVEKYLERCINSVIHQTYKNIEVILVDDGSPDNCPMMCDAWAEKDNRIKVIHKPNAGLGFARNSGLEIATGDYIAFIDSDDYVDLDMYETLLSKSMQEDADIVFCGCHCESCDKLFTDYCDFKEETTFFKNDMHDLSLLYIAGVKRIPLQMSVWHSIYKRDVIKTFFYSERECVSEDIHFQLSAILNASKVIYIPQAYYYYCFNEGSLSHTFLIEKYDREKVLIKYLMDLYNRHNYNENHILNRYLFYRVKSTIKSIITDNHNSPKQKKIYIDCIVRDMIWKDLLSNINIKELVSIDAKIFFILLKLKATSLIYYTSQLYYHYQNHNSR